MVQQLWFPEGHDVYELAKMSVTESWQGKGISKLLLESCLQKAEELGALRIELFSNHQLKNALKLYEKYGFGYIEMKIRRLKRQILKWNLFYITHNKFSLS